MLFICVEKYAWFGLLKGAERGARPRWGQHREIINAGGGTLGGCRTLLADRFGQQQQLPLAFVRRMSEV